jgi:ATP-dependent RNA helicase DDX19/DBP5
MYLQFRKPEILRALAALSYSRPTQIQSRSLNIILGMQNHLVAQAQSGSGKTACFVLALLNAVKPQKEYIQGLCIAPTIELARQIHVVVEKLGQFLPLRIACTVMKESFKGKSVPHLVIGTPGTLKSAIKAKELNGKIR